ncbi:MAG: GDP-L-fucose synthase [Deltaproteobacteria bacterium]|nr:GDP-L-fucose synthase [Deltaproteobacteria bacterium]
MEKDAKIYVAGHRGLAGSAITRALRTRGYERIVERTHAELDLTDARAVNNFFNKERPEYVFLAAAKVGGILANSTYPVEFIRDNLKIEISVLDAAWRFGVKRLLFLGSSCIYPRLAPQPMKEEYLMTGPFEPTNSPYALAKIAGIELCRSYNGQYGTSFLPVMPAGLYGPGADFDLVTSHVLPALIRRFHEAKRSGNDKVVIWGTGSPRREFLHVDDLANACIFLMKNYDGADLINIGWGKDISIRELAEIVSNVVGFEGTVEFDDSKPDGAPRKRLDTSKISALGWKPAIELKEGIRRTYEWFKTHFESTSGSNP